MISIALALTIAAAPSPHRLRWEPRVDLPVAGTLVLGWVLSEFAFKGALAADTCRWCATNDFDLAVRRAFNPSLTPSASGVRPIATASDLLAFIVMPLTVAGLDLLGARDSDSPWLTWAVDLVIMIESTFSALAVNQAVKFAVGRARPYSIDAPHELLESARDPHDHNLSFFSGHTTFTVGLTVASGVVGMLRGYKLAWLTWAVAAPMAIATATMRMAADKHWMSDILVGALVGGGVSLALPLLLHGREPSGVSLRVTPTPNGAALAGTF